MSSSSGQVKVEVFERLLKREKAARKESERLLEAKSVELYDANENLRGLAKDLEARVELRTMELEIERNLAVATSEARRVSEARYNDVASIVGEYLWELDQAFCFVSVTTQVEDVLGCSAQELIGRSFFEFMPAGDEVEVRGAMLERLDVGGHFVHLIHRRVAMPNAVQWLRSSGKACFNTDGEWTGFLGASLDVTEQECAKLETQKLVIALEHAADGVAITSGSRGLTFANRAFVKMFGCADTTEALGMEWSQFVAADDVGAMSPEIERLFASERQSYNTEGRGLRKDDREFPAHFSINSLPNGDLLWVCRDESERLNTLMGVQTQNSQLSALLENILVGVIFESDCGGGLIYNPAVCSMLGVDRSVLDNACVVEQIFSRLRDASSDFEFIEQVNYLLSLRAEAFNIELSFGQERHLLFDRIPVFVGELYRGALWTARDVTEERRRGEVLEEARFQAEAGARAKSTFLANMSHEIRTPLNGICGMARLLRGEAMNDAAQDYVRAIQMSGDSLLHVLNDILDFSKVEANQLELEVSPFEMSHVMDSTFAILQAQAKDILGRFDFVYPEVRLPRLKGDAGRLGEILLNLLGNALKFANGGNVDLRTRLVSLDDDGVVLELIVQDCGIGMTPEEVDRVFQPFSQADSSTSRRFGGTGLGLTICRDLSKLMGGSLSLESELGVGSTFTVQMPYELAESPVRLPMSRLDPSSLVIVNTFSDVFFDSVQSILATAGIAACRVEGEAKVQQQLALLGQDHSLVILDCVQSNDCSCCDAGNAIYDGLKRLVVCRNPHRFAGQSDNLKVLGYPFSRFKMLTAVHMLYGCELPEGLFDHLDGQQLDSIDLTGLRVLLAEDNQINQKVGRITIERFGAEVDVAASGVEALELVQGFNYDLILMDIRMPEMDGVEATRRIRDLGFTLPIYALTADAMKGDRERFLAAGMDGYLSKPLVEKELVDLLADARHKLPTQEAPAVVEEEHLGAMAQETVEGPQAERVFVEGDDAMVLDVESFKELLGGDMEIVSSILDEFIDSAELYYAEAKAALEVGDYDVARSRFHKLAGSSASVFASQLRVYCLSGERLMVDAIYDEASLSPLLAAIESGLPKLRAEIERISKQTR